MTYTTPCAEPDADADDWFIGRDGKQYPDDDLLTEQEVRGLTRSVLAIEGETAEEHRDRVDATMRLAETDRRRQALGRRRRAREACFGCEVRLACLDIAVTEEHLTGTWGGYTEEQLRELRREMRRRRPN